MEKMLPRIIFTIIMLSVYRLGTYVPLHGIDPEALQNLMSDKQKGLLGMFNMFSGGALKICVCLLSFGLPSPLISLVSCLILLL